LKSVFIVEKPVLRFCEEISIGMLILARIALLFKPSKPDQSEMPIF